MTYQKTIQCKQFADIDFRCIKIGQWVENRAGQKGQYMGMTKRGDVMIAWRCMRYKLKDRIMQNQNIFETGATSFASNNLILSVMSDGAVYQQRIDAGNRILQGKDPIIGFREIANNESIKQRALFDSKFKPQEITEAGKIIQDITISDILEDMALSYDPSQNIYAIVRRWFDKANGNSYFSCRVTVPLEEGKRISFVIPLQYGYGSQPESEIVAALFRLNILKEKKDYFSEYNIILEDQGYMRKNQNWINGLYL